jgi:septal ring factor EnvC (AmiA/AmiB activator)
LRSLERIAGELFESVSLLASGSISFELVDAITTLENNVKQLEQENAHVNGVVAAQAKELEDSKRAFNKKTKKLERAKKTLEEQIASFEKDIKEYDHPSALFASWKKEEEEEKDGYENHLKKTVASSVRAIASRYEEALAHVERDHPESYCIVPSTSPLVVVLVPRLRRSLRLWRVITNNL